MNFTHPSPEYHANGSTNTVAPFDGFTDDELECEDPLADLTDTERAELEAAIAESNRMELQRAKRQAPSLRAHWREQFEASGRDIVDFTDGDETLARDCGFRSPTWDDQREDEKSDVVNVPCRICGRFDLPLHTNYNCAECGPDAQPQTQI